MEVNHREAFASNNGILKNNCYNTPTSTSQYFLVLGPPEARKPQYEKIFTSRIDNTRKYLHLELTIRENIHSSQSQYKKIFTSRGN